MDGIEIGTLEDDGTTLVLRRHVALPVEQVWSHVADRQRKELVFSKLLCVAGRVERQGEVVHLIAGRLIDQTPMLSELDFSSRDFH